MSARAAPLFVLCAALGLGACQCLAPVVDPGCLVACRRSEACIDGECRPISPGDGGVDAGHDAGVDGGADAGTDGGVCSSCAPGMVCEDGGCVADFDGGTIGAACGSNLQCTSSTWAVCLLDADGWTRGACSLGCNAPGFDPLCQGGVCFLYRDGDQKLCLPECVDASDCRPGYVCQSRLLPQNVSVKTCQPRCEVNPFLCDLGQSCSDAGTCR